MPRPRKVDRCLGSVKVKDRLFHCQRKAGHAGPHSKGPTRWSDPDHA